MKKPSFYITTPIYYSSGKPHIGHAYCSIAADTMARYKRMRGFDVAFLTGTDDHGQKIQTEAKKLNITPKEFVDKNVALFKDLWKLLDISNDRFIRTTDDKHKKAATKIFNDLYERGEIYKGKYDGLYCTPCESFWTETQLVDGACPDCGRKVEPASEEAYFFRLSKYSDKLLAYYEENPRFCVPQSRVNEMRKFIDKGLEDLCVSRTSFDWGIPVEFDKKHVMYVWVDALSNYITALGYSSEDDSAYQKYWPADIHLVGKEIMRFHAIIWPAMLMALDLPLPKQIYGHGWLLFDNDKMSKSKGNVVDPVIICQRYGVDPFRYFLLRDITFGQDGNFTNELLINRINSDIANDLGNLLSRTTAMAVKYFGGRIPDIRESDDVDEELKALAISVKEKVENYLNDMQFSYALAEIWKLVSRTNKYIDETSPWILGKQEDKQARLASVIYNLCESLRIISVLLEPFMPHTSPKIQEQIGAQTGLNWDDTGEWGLYEGSSQINKGEALFNRIDTDKEIEELNAIIEAQKAASQAPPAEEAVEQIEIDDFSKVQLKVAEIKACEPVKGAKKLLRLTLDDGSGEERTVASGIAQWYKPEDLINRRVILVANLKPAKIRGVESQGMILAADCADGKVKVAFADDMPVGAKIR